MLDRRKLLLLSFGAFVSPRFAWASGHNGFCVLRDSGGAYLAQRQIIVHGKSYETFRAQALASAQPQTVLVETRAGYTTAIRDARSGRLPPGSIAVFDRSRYPEGVVDGFQKEIKRTTLYFNVPETLQEAKNVHGRIERIQLGLSDSILEAYLPLLKEVADRYRALGGIKIEPQGGMNAADWLASQIAAHGENELVVIASHVARTSVLLTRPDGSPSSYPTGRLPLIDGSVYSMDKAKASGPTVWTVGCETWDLELGRLDLGKSELAFTTKISYPESVAVVRKILPGKTVSQKINGLQKEPWATQRLPESGEIRPVDVNHPLPGAPRSLGVMAEVIQDKNIVTTDKMLA
jgi:hypothetical protein